MQNLLNWDQSLFLKINGLAGGWLDYFFAWPTFLGEIYIFIPIVFLFLLIWDSKNALPNILKILACALAAGLINHILKDLFDRPRPWKFYYDAIDQGKVIVHFIFKNDTARSFPSGHSTSIFALAFTLHQIYGKKVIWIYPFAIWIAITRVYCGAHFPLDILGGSLVGTFVAAMSYWLLEKARLRFQAHSTN